MPSLTVNNLTAHELPVNRYIPNIAANNSVTVELSQYELDKSIAHLEEMVAASLVSFTVAPTTRTTDDAAESVVIGYLANNVLAEVGGVTVTVNGATISVKATTGAPSSSGNKGDVIINTADGDLYINQDGSTTWALVTHA